MALNFDTLLVLALGAWALWQLRRLVLSSKTSCGGCDKGCKTTTPCTSTTARPITLVRKKAG